MIVYVYERPDKLREPHKVHAKFCNVTAVYKAEGGEHVRIITPESVETFDTALYKCVAYLK